MHIPSCGMGEGQRGVVGLTCEVQGGGGVCQGTISTGIIPDGENFAISRNPEASNTLFVLGGLRTTPVLVGTKISSGRKVRHFS